MTYWHQLDGAQVLQQLETDANCGLSHEEASRRLQQHGLNELMEQPPKSLWQMLWEQLTATAVLVLIAGAAISAFLGDLKDTTAILAIVGFNAILGISQEQRAEQAFAALKKLTVSKVKVCRDGRWQELAATQLVPGDIVMLEAGELVPADSRVLKSFNLRVREAAFTGESESSEKLADPVQGEDLSLGDHHSMVFMGTVVTTGRGQAVVTETGMNTQLGKITRDIQTVATEPTPLQNRLEQLGRKLAIATLVLVAIIFVLGLLRGESLHMMILTALSVAVAVIPEGLPAVVTIALAIGSQRMLNHQALIRRLPAVETLGSVTVICSDKTGTLTENRMTVVTLEGASQRLDLKELLPSTTQSMGQKFLTADRAPFSDWSLPILLLTGAALCNDALLSNFNEATPSEALGDPTEIALIVAAAYLGLHKGELEKQYPRIAEVPFDSDRKRMTTIHQRVEDPQSWVLEKIQLKTQNSKLKTPFSTPYIAFTKGAVTNLLEVASQVWTPEGIEPLDAEWLERIQCSNDELAQTGMRVLGIAFRLLEAIPSEGNGKAIEQDLVFVGFVGMRDPARAEVAGAVQLCQRAGIRPVMITGDHPLMAQHIAKELGIATNSGLLTGKDLNQLSLQELEEKVETVAVYARVSPQQKLKIVQALQNKGHIVAMTGDGINDAPALRKADIGLAMGIAGTDVAKEAADMVLLDDNFATIVAAVEEGRVIYDNIRKFIKYSMTGNASGVWIMLLAPLLAMPLPLLPLQILWINLLADGLLAIALSVEPAEQETMRRPPYRPDENIFGRGVARDILWVGLLVGLAVLLLGYKLWAATQVTWQTMVFVTLALSRMSLALAMRSERDSLFTIGLTTNIPMLVAVVLTFCLQIAVVYVPWLQELFHTQALSTPQLCLSLAVSTIGFWAIELEKWVLRRFGDSNRRSNCVAVTNNL
ncbi:cation-translocating P-type ATPase [Leptothermofonsia sp. ETS-13]|uniref:cation-translocating P-type ATPase n=1 Tax=Leptothermofonsia sp. ETS-13 TaxID=3035696 RepID=UPI003BA13941